MWPIDRLNPQHAAQYRALMLEAYARHPESFTSSVQERAALPLAWWEARLSDSASAKDVVLGAHHEGEIVGVVGVSFSARERARHKALLFGMYVPASHQGKGLGRALLEAALEAARRRQQVRVVQLTVTETNHNALKLYEQCGFASFGVEPYAVALGDGFIAKVHMWRTLDR
jgi:GNAT superfamily N-acetyltransferase